MDPTKKRKLEENGSSPDPTQTQTLTVDDARKILSPFSHDQLLDILQTAVISHPDVLTAVRSIADRDVTQRKLFIRGLGWETTSDSLRSVFAPYGDLQETVVIQDKATGKSKGYGFVTYKHVDGAVLALKEPSKKIDSRVAVAQLAAAGGPHGGGGGNNMSGGVGSDVSLRKIFVGNVGHDMSSELLLSLFSGYGEIEEGPLGFDKQTGKSKGFALFVYKSPEGAQNALIEPVKNINGRQLMCKLAIDGKKGNPGGGGGGVGPGQGPGPVGDGQMPGPYGGPAPGPNGPGGYAAYGGYSGGQNSNPLNQISGGGGGYGSSGGGYGGPAGYAGTNSTSYGGGPTGYGGGPNSSGYGGGPNSSGYGGGPNSSGYAGGANVAGYGSYGGGVGRGYGGPGMTPSSGYSDGGSYGMGSGGYPSQQHQSVGNSPAARVPPAGSGGYSNPPPPYY